MTDTYVSKDGLMVAENEYRYVVQTCGIRFGPFESLEDVFQWCEQREQSIYETSTDTVPMPPPDFTVMSLRIPGKHA